MAEETKVAQESMTPEADANVEAAAPDNAVILTPPAPGETKTVQVREGSLILTDFDLSAQTIDISGGNLLIEFDNGGVIVLEDFASFADQETSPTFVMADGTMIPSALLLASLTEAPLETASEAQRAGGGIGEYRDDLGTLLDGIDRLGAQDSDTFARNEPQQLIDEQAVPLLVQTGEPATPGEPVAPEEPVTPDVGHEVTVEATSVTVDEADLQTVEIMAAESSSPAVGTITVDAPDGLATVTVGGVTVVSAGALIAGAEVALDGGVLTFSAFNQATGQLTYNFDLTGSVAHPEGNGNNSLVQTVEVVATDVDGSSNTTTFDVTIVDDVPTIDVTGDTTVVEGASITNGTWTSDPGADAPAAIKVVFNGTEHDLGTGFDTGKGTLTVNTDGTWTFIAADGLDQDEAQGITFDLKITDADGDTHTDSHNLTITDGAAPTVGEPIALTVDEADIATPAATDSGASSFTLGSDAIAAIAFSGTVGTITGDFADADLTWALSADGQTLSGTVTGESEASIILTLNGVNLTTGNYTVNVQMTDEFKHATANSTNSFTISDIEILATDIDGTTATGLASVDIIDDVPTDMQAENATTIDEAQLRDANGNYPTASGDLSDNGEWGADGFGRLTQFQIAGEDVVIPEGGSITIYLAENGSYQGTNADGAAASLLVSSDGNYKFTLLDNIFIRGEGAQENTATVTFTGVDGDGDPATISLNLTLKDDVPTAVNDTGSIQSGDTLTVAATAGLLANDTLGADGATVTAVDDSTAQGSLTWNADGSYTYTALANATYTDTFTYTLTDGDGDTDTATLTIDVTDGSPIAPAANVVVNEAALDLMKDGNDLVAGTVTGSDPTSTAETITGTLAATDPNGDALTYTAGTFPGSYGTLTINATGNYTYTLTAPYTTTPAANDGAIAIDNAESFTYTVTDANGNSTTGTLTVDIIDDVPSAVADTGSVQSGGTLTVAATAGLLANDTLGADGATVTAVDDSTAQGSLTWNADGSYTYTALANATYTDTFTYTLTDGDGDTDTATLTIDVTDGSPIAPAANVVVNEAALDLVKDGNDLVAGTVTGSDPTSTAETITGTLAATDPNGDALTYTAGTVDGNYGTIQINSDGTYIYTLTKPYTTDPATNDGVTTIENAESFNYTVTDAYGNSSQGTLTVDITDDVPISAVTNGIIQNSQGAVLEGTLASIGADVDGSITLTGTPPPDLTSMGQPLTYQGVGTSTIVATIPDTDGNGTIPVFTLTGNPDGTYQFTQHTSFDLTELEVDTITQGGAGGPEPAYYIYEDGSFGSDASIDWAVKITATGGSGGNAGLVNTNANSMGVGNPILSTGETMRFDFDNDGDSGGQDFYSSAEIRFTTLTDSEIVNWTAQIINSEDEIHQVSGQATATTMNGIINVAVPQEYSDYYIDYIELSPGPDTAVGVTSVSTYVTNDTNLANLDFNFTATDGDGDSITGTLNIISQTSSTLLGDTADNALAGGPGGNFLVGGEGDDLLFGGDGADHFVFSAASNEGHDTIGDFTPSEDTLSFYDVLDPDDNGELNSDEIEAFTGSVIITANSSNHSDVTLTLNDGSGTSITLEGINNSGTFDTYDGQTLQSLQSGPLALNIDINPDHFAT